MKYYHIIYIIAYEIFVLHEQCTFAETQDENSGPGKYSLQLL